MKVFVRAIVLVVLILAALVALAIGISYLHLGPVGLSQNQHGSDMNGILALIAAAGMIYYVFAELLDRQ